MMTTNAHKALSDALADATSEMERLADCVEAFQAETITLREMHSQLAKLNVERQKTIEALADMARDLYFIAVPFMSDGDSVWRAMKAEYIAAMKLAGHDLKI